MSTNARMLVLLLACASTAAAAQQPPAAQKPNIQMLLDSGYDLTAVLPGSGPCGNQPATQGRTCGREVYFLQSPQKNRVFRCERGTWNGTMIDDCTPVT